ncbi:hypothetical protein [Chryseobacterium potabilaquae]|uniref:Uncharacterized protein n=1 Tax=Chryseobacterium potabilaquae TaxID=2675057 RepID=A0A6N4X9M9_9FLAO|nr:hypothetical protein [Chryseobacterium potabilaquae]CAA7196994.1 hypothetical protein CHRY9293_03052 [Chryseobacterium potabilaquae]
MRKKYETIKNWIYAHPKQVYKYVMIFLFFSFVFSIIQFFYFPTKFNYSIAVSPIYSAPSAKQKVKSNEIEMGKIVEELKKYKEKRDSTSLTKADSLRIDYLYNQFNQLKSGY